MCKTSAEMFCEQQPIQYMLHKQMRDHHLKGPKFLSWLYEVVQKGAKPHLLSARDMLSVPFIEWYDQGLSVDQAAPKIIIHLTGNQ